MNQLMSDLRTAAGSRSRRAVTDFNPLQTKLLNHISSITQGVRDATQHDVPQCTAMQRCSTATQDWAELGRKSIAVGCHCLRNYAVMFGDVERKTIARTKMLKLRIRRRVFGSRRLSQNDQIWARFSYSAKYTIDEPV